MRVGSLRWLTLLLMSLTPVRTFYHSLPTRIGVSTKCYAFANSTISASSSPMASSSTSSTTSPLPLSPYRHPPLYQRVWAKLSRRKDSHVEEDGYTTVYRGDRVLRALRKLARWRKPGTLILIRHGESQLNYNRTFTGWIDVDLNERGIKETEHAARLLLEQGYEIDVTYTSRLKRAIRSAWILMRELNQIYKPVFKSWRLNERMYGTFEGMSKPGLAQELGESVVQSYRTSLDARPPAMTPEHPHWHHGEKKYQDLEGDQIPVTESLQDTMDRTLPLWYSRILPDVQAGRTVMIVAHANSLRGIVKHIDGLSREQIQTVAIPNGIPLVYKFDRSMTPIKQDGAVSPISGEFLEKKGLLRAALAKEVELARHVPGNAEEEQQEDPSLLDPRIRGLVKLTEDRKLIDVALGIAGLGKPVRPASKQQQLNVLKNITSTATAYTTPASARGINWAITKPPGTSRMKKVEPSIRDPLVVIIRHGKTEYNKLGVFTGWEDAPLSNDGRVEARKAGKLLKRHGIELDVVYTSWLSRAIETAWLVLDELDSLWLPLIKSWRLNERMYGALTGLSKKMIAQRHGDSKFKEWRRSYGTRPPEVSSFSSHYPGNDDRYVKYARDLRISISESFIRSLSRMKFQLHRKFPKTESLKDCMSRTIPYYTNTIVPQAIALNQTVMISSSENAIRGLLMHLCDISPDRISEVEIPTGLPLVYNMRKRCIQLLEVGDEDPSDPVGHLNFGSSPELLFRPCNASSTEDEDQCYVGASGKTYAWDPLIRLPPLVEEDVEMDDQAQQDHQQAAIVEEVRHAHHEQGAPVEWGLIQEGDDEEGERSVKELAQAR